MIIALTRNEWISKISAIVIAIICFAGNYYMNNAKLIYECCLLICGILLFQSVKHKYLFVVLLVISSYVILLFPYFLNNLRIGTFNELNQAALYQKAIYIFSVFLASLLFFFKEVPYVPIVDRLPVFDNNLIYYVNAVAMVAILIFGASGESVLDTAYGQNQGSMSVIYVYFPIFFLASYVSSGRTVFKTFFLLTIAAAFVVKSLLFGGRGNAVTMLIIVYMLFLDKKLSFKALILIIIAGFTFFSFWAQYRMGIRNIDFYSLYSFGASYNDKYSAAGNNQTDVFYASVRLISLKDFGLISDYDSLKSFALFLVSIVVPYSVLPPLANLSTYLLSSFNSLGGGLMFSYFYVYFSYFGVVIGAFYVSWVFTKLRSSRGLFALFYGILVSATVIGWFAYHPITMFKLCLLGACYIMGLTLLSRQLVKS